MSRRSFQLNLWELAEEFFDIQGGELDPVGTTVINEAIAFAATAIHVYQQLEAEAIAYVQQEMDDDEYDGDDDDDEFDDEDEGPSPITAHELVNVVRLENLAVGKSSLAHNISTALAYLFERQHQALDWDLLMQELQEIDDPKQPK